MLIAGFRNMLFRIFSGFKWQLLLIWPAVLIFVYICFFANCPLIYKKTNEIIAPLLLSLTMLIYIYRVYKYRNHLEIILLALSAVFLCREFHFQGTTRGTYISLVIIIIWCIIWRKSIAEIFFKNPAKSYLVVTLLTYLLSQLIARRALDGIIPFCAANDIIKTGLEEISENTAHLLFLVTALKGFNLK